MAENNDDLDDDDQSQDRIIVFQYLDRLLEYAIVSETYFLRECTAE